MTEKSPSENDQESYEFPMESNLKNYKLQPTSLQVALKGMAIADVLPKLSEEERKVLLARYRLVNATRYRSQKAAAKILGLSVEEYRRFEGEALDQVSLHAGIGRADHGDADEIIQE